MLTALIIDDEEKVVKHIEYLIRMYTPEVNIISSTTNAEEAINNIENLKPDIVFLDVKMPIINGFELLDKLRYTNFYLVFSTAHQEFGIRALRKNAIDYLVKPLIPEDMIGAIDRIKKDINQRDNQAGIKRLIEELKNRNLQRISLHTRNSIELVYPSQIVMLEAKSNATYATLSNFDKYHVNTSLKDYEKLLCSNANSQFMRVHHSFIINLNYVTGYSYQDNGQVVISGKKMVPISKFKKEEFFKSINLS